MHISQTSDENSLIRNSPSPMGITGGDSLPLDRVRWCCEVQSFGNLSVTMRQVSLSMEPTQIWRQNSAVVMSSECCFQPRLKLGYPMTVSSQCILSIVYSSWNWIFLSLAKKKKPNNNKKNPHKKQKPKPAKLIWLAPYLVSSGVGPGKASSCFKEEMIFWKGDQSIVYGRRLDNFETWRNK